MAITNAGYDQGREKNENGNRQEGAKGEKKIYRSAGNYTPKSEGRTYNNSNDEGRRKNNQGNMDRSEKREYGHGGYTKSGYNSVNRSESGAKSGDQRKNFNRDKNDVSGQGFKKNNQGGFKGGQGGYKVNKGFEFKDKDEEDEVRRPRPKAQTSSKPKEQASDKLEIKNRLEREKKAVKKKQAESSKKEQRPRTMVKPKRTGNIDWTRAYENDEYDDDDFDAYL